MRRLTHWIAWAGVILFILLYPMLISIYVTLPLFVGYAGWQIVRGIDGGGWRRLLLPMLYLLNLEINLSLPLLLTLAAVLIYYLFFYSSVLYLKRCPLCVAIFSVLFIDLIYLGLIEVYDFIFSSASIEINLLLLYSLAMDVLAVVFL